MKYLIILILFASCNPLVTKELRKKNKCNRKFEKLANKCDIMSSDTIRDTLIVIIPEIKDSTTISIIVDSSMVKGLEIALDSLKSHKDKVRYVDNYVKRSFNVDTSYTFGEITFFLKINNGVINVAHKSPERKIKKIVETPYKTFSKVELTFLEHLQNVIAKFWWLILVVFAIYILLRWFKK